MTSIRLLLTCYWSNGVLKICNKSFIAEMLTLANFSYCWKWHTDTVSTPPTAHPRPVFKWSVSLAHVTVAHATKWHIRAGKSIEVWEYRAHFPVPLPVLGKYVTGWWANLMLRIAWVKRQPCRAAVNLQWKCLKGRRDCVTVICQTLLAVSFSHHPPCLLFFFALVKIFTGHCSTFCF